MITRERKWDLRFETNEDTVIAREHLPPVLGERLRVNIERYASRGKFVRRSGAALSPSG